MPGNAGNYMNETSKFLRYVTPGLAFAVELGVVLWLAGVFSEDSPSKKRIVETTKRESGETVSPRHTASEERRISLEKTETSNGLSKLGKDNPIVLAVGTLVASGGVGFLLSVFHHGLVWTVYSWLIWPADWLRDWQKCCKKKYEVAKGCCRCWFGLWRFILWVLHCVCPRLVIDYRELVEEMRRVRADHPTDAPQVLSLLHCSDTSRIEGAREVEAGRKLTLKGAWRVGTVIVLRRAEVSKEMQGVGKRLDRMCDTMHAIGATLVGSYVTLIVLAILTWGSSIELKHPGWSWGLAIAFGSSLIPNLHILFGHVNSMSRMALWNEVRVVQDRGRNGNDKRRGKGEENRDDTDTLPMRIVVSDADLEGKI